MNYGVSLSNGKYVVFMNAGDTFYSDVTLAKVLKILSSSNQIPDILFGGAVLNFGVSGRKIYRPPRLAETYLWHGLPANHQATFYKKTLLNKTPYDLQFRLCGDYYLAAILLKNGAYAVYLNESLAIFMVGGESYKNLKRLFLEPYLIQRDVLCLPFLYRLLSAIRRLISTAGFIFFSQSILKKNGITRN